MEARMVSDGMILLLRVQISVRVRWFTCTIFRRSFCQQPAAAAPQRACAHRDTATRTGALTPLHSPGSIQVLHPHTLSARVMSWLGVVGSVAVFGGKVFVGLIGAWFVVWGSCWLRYFAARRAALAKQDKKARDDDENEERDRKEK